MYNIIYEMSRQSRLDARYWMLGAGALGQPRGMVRGGRKEEGSGWDDHSPLSHEVCIPGQPSPLVSGLCLNTSLAEGRLRDVLALGSVILRDKTPARTL